MNPRPIAIRRLFVLVSICLMLGAASAAFAQGAGNPFGDCPEAKPTFETLEKEGDGWRLTRVRIECKGTVIFADNLRFDAKTIFATGNIVVTQKDLRVNAERMEMDRVTKLGTFYQAYGTATLAETVDTNLFGSFEPQVWFHGEKIERIGPRAYRLTKGVFSTCTQPNARWEMKATSGTVILDDHASLTNIQFRVKGIPILYIPYLYYPMKKEDRSTGILIPNYSKSSLNGHGFSNAFFWAMKSNMDATFNHDYFSKTGQGVGAEYRYIASNASRGNFKFYGFKEKERLGANGTTVERPAHTWYRFDGSLNQQLGTRFALYGNTNYSTDITAQQLYQQNVYDLTNRTRTVDFTLTGQSFGAGSFARRLRLNANVNQTDTFTGTSSQGRSATPKVNLFLNNGSLNRSKLGSLITYGGAVEVARFELRDTNRPTISVRRMDASGTIRSPLSSYDWLSVNTSATGRITEWLDTVDPLTGLQRSAPLTRGLFDLQAGVTGPRLEKVFDTPKNRYAERFKHLIEPSVSVAWLSPFDRASEIIKVDGVDQAVGGTTTLNYSLVNRILARRRTADGSGQIRQMLFVVIRQTYYSNADAGAVDGLYSNAAAGRISPVLVQAQFSPVESIGASFSMSKNSVSWPKPGGIATNVAYNVTGFVDKEHVDINAGWSRTDYLTAAQGFIDVPTTHSASANVSVNGRGLGVAYGFNLDVPTGRLIQQRISAYYRAQCCGIAFDYQERNGLQLTSFPADRRFAVTFTLAGIGSFSPPLSGLGR